MKQCLITGCNSKIPGSRGWCHKHYVRFLRHSDPNKTVHVMHGMADSPEYDAWIGMIGRCHNPNSSSYRYYGERGIRVCPRWRKSFSYFYTDMGRRPKGLTLERINNNEGYYPKNCKWATRLEQSRNRRKYNNNTSGVTGVEWHKQNEKWAASITVKGKHISLGCYSNKLKAIKARRVADKFYANA